MELGGSDQLFNLIYGRHYQHAAHQTPQICVTLPLLEGLDGINKMSKSLGNHIGLAEPPNEQFGKAMRMGDDLVPKFARLVLFRKRSDVAALRLRMRDGANPMEEKKRIAFAIVERYNDAAAARSAREHFEQTVQRREMPCGDAGVHAGGCAKSRGRDRPRRVCIE